MVNSLFNNIYKDKRVLITGIFGFKGSWLAFWLAQMGARVYGYSLRPDTELSHYPLLDLTAEVTEADIRDDQHLLQVFQNVQPEIVFHLAAQPLVRLSYKNPVETFDVNVMGTLKVFEACRHTPSVRAIVNVTSDKCYQNREWYWGYRETDAMGGHDPYSASKGCAELLTASYRNSYFAPGRFGTEHHTLLASVRAGNVIGGGDWALDRLIPDLVKASMNRTAVSIRYPRSIRPWQHVLDPLSGYLCLGQRLLEGNPAFAEDFNFGPSADTIVTVGEIAEYFKENFAGLQVSLPSPVDAANVHEAVNLRLDCSKAKYKLDWAPVWNVSKTLERTVKWYQLFIATGKANTAEDLETYINTAKQQGLPWTA
ncbi:MAG: CDP-glucose 4,6-dehydratase [Chitinophagaceae bacterium]|nr:CDP-glucose 4,6-dehydratase [Chitinophagaceae bacterium]